MPVEIDQSNTKKNENQTKDARFDSFHNISTSALTTGNNRVDYHSGALALTYQTVSSLHKKCVRSTKSGGMPAFLTSSCSELTGNRGLKGFQPKAIAARPKFS